ncbi:hypothetical protein SPI_04390 [Niveomyces insectorum RCEF 264]|uniref:Zn(2)-C6 fungal-type domain-containing protein n=1 Tax=Niveomyces insectorum RCEF 264 TaxID=1081102 RepID=A0A167VPG2_9HYPO|nr:hypothetical protein SPI_04390 [Niveomyces insectorum RCEF 264]
MPPAATDVVRRSAGEEDRRAKATAKWGAACAACASGKAKCIRTNSAPGAKCDRCERLYKDCTTQVHRPRKKRASKPSRTAQLEERLNGLVDLLRASGELPTLSPQGGTASPGTAPSVEGRPEPSVTSPRPSPADTGRASSAVPGAPPAPIPSTYNSLAPPTCICHPIEPNPALVVESDDELVAKFRTHMLPVLPIVVLPPPTAEATTAAQLAADRPFLLLAIRTAASSDNYQSMQHLMYQLVSHVADYMLMRAQRSLDLLQGLLVVLCWYHHHCMLHSKMNMLLHLAAGLLSDLGLHRAPRVAEHTTLLVLHPNEPKPRTNEERRALLGLWYLTSSVALCFQKIQMPRFSPYIRQCLQELDDAREFESDTVVCALVRLQHLAENVAAINNRDETATDEVFGFPRAPKSAYQLVFQDELDRLCAGVPAHIQESHLIQSHIDNITLRLYEPPLIDLVLLQKLSAATLGAASTSLTTALDRLYRIHDALRQFYDHFFAVPISDYQWMPLPMYMHMVHGITMLSRWARLVGPVRADPGAPGPALNGGNPATLEAGHLALAATSNGHSTAPSSASTASATASSTATVATTATPAATSIASSALFNAPVDYSTPATPRGQDAPPVPSVILPIESVPGVDPRELNRDPALLAAVMHLRANLRRQPGLQLDVPGLLATLRDRFEQSNRALRAANATKFGDAVARGITVWEMTARKIAVMQIKMQRYLDGSAALHGTAAAPADMRAENAQQQNPVQHLGQPGHDGVPVQNGGSRVTPGQPLVQGGLPTDLGRAPGSGGTTNTDLRDTGQGLSGPGNLDSWAADPLWADDAFDNMDIGLWAENMDWMAALN